MMIINNQYYRSQIDRAILDYRVNSQQSTEDVILLEKVIETIFIEWAKAQLESEAELQQLILLNEY